MTDDNLNHCYSFHLVSSSIQFDGKLYIQYRIINRGILLLIHVVVVIVGHEFFW